MRKEGRRKGDGEDNVREREECLPKSKSKILK